MLSPQELRDKIAETIRLLVKGSDRMLGLTEDEYEHYKMHQTDLWILNDVLLNMEDEGRLSDEERVLLDMLLDEQEAWGNISGQIIWNADGPKQAVGMDDGEDGLGDLVEIPEDALLWMTDPDEWIRQYGNTLWRDAEKVNPLVPTIRKAKRARKSVKEAAKRVAKGEPIRERKPLTDEEWFALKRKVQLNDLAWEKTMERWYDPRSWGFAT